MIRLTPAGGNVKPSCPPYRRGAGEGEGVTVKLENEAVQVRADEWRRESEDRASRAGWVKEEEATGREGEAEWY